MLDNNTLYRLNDFVNLKQDKILLIHTGTTCVLSFDHQFPLPPWAGPRTPSGHGWWVSDCSLSLLSSSPSVLFVGCGRLTLPRYAYSVPLYCITQTFLLRWLVLRRSPCPSPLIADLCTLFLSSALAQLVNCHCPLQVENILPFSELPGKFFIFSVWMSL